jgi:hypothetical protein
MKYHFMYICNTEVYGSKELFQTGKIDDPLYGKISLTYRFSIMDEFLLLLFPCLIGTFISTTGLSAADSSPFLSKTLHSFPVESRFFRPGPDRCPRRRRRCSVEAKARCRL